MWRRISITAVLFFCICAVAVNARPNLKESEEEFESENKARKCGYEGCPVPDPDMINVHMVPHTHDDVGWLKTVDQYYYGSKTLIQKAGVQYIIDSFIQELINDPNKRFIYVESAFFSKWWSEQTPKMKRQVKKLVNEGRLEFINGAWSMNDEAATHYNSIIDHFAWGLKFLDDNFGKCARPRIGWQIDPFGHSKEQASIFAQMGFDGMFFGRLDYQDKQHRLDTKTMEMVWHASEELGRSSDIFTGVNFNLYQAPSTFCFDILCADEPMIDDPNSPDYNVDRRVNEFFKYVKEQAKHYRSNNVMMTMGGDFTYMDANVYYKNMDKLIKYANDRQESGSKINLFYSTPSCYLKALHESNATWPEKSDDFFPYGSDKHSYWTGYYTSRPTQKRFEREGNHFLQVCKQLSSFANQHKDEFLPKLNKLREAMGVMQHHDAITGTEKQHVAQDYARMMSTSVDACAENTMQVLNQFTTRQTFNASETPFEFKICPQMNVSMCETTENSDRFIVTVYNPRSHVVFYYVTIPVNGANYMVMDYRNVLITHQIMSIPESVQNLEHREGNATHQLTFLAPEVPALGFKSFYISKITNDESSSEQISEETVSNEAISEEISVSDAEDQTIGNKYMTLSFDDAGLIQSIETADGEIHNISQTFAYYIGALGNNYIAENRSSGAYIFRPNGTELMSLSANLTIVRGPHVEEARQVFSDWITQIIRLYREENYVEFEWMVGPIPIEDGKGKEIISRFHTEIDNDGVFYTDSNGREMIKRVRNHRDTWNLTLLEQASGNYYPVTARIAIEDKKTRMAILNDRAQGGSSLFDGIVELMVHRRLLKDDAFGVEEALNETEHGAGLIARGKHWLTIGKKTIGSPSMKAQERFLQNEKLMPCQLFFSDAQDIDYASWMSRYSNIYSAMSFALPKNIHLLTFEPWNQDKLNGHTYLVRFEHIMASKEDIIYSKAVTFNLQDHFRGFDIGWIRETTLDGNQFLDDAVRFEFQTDSDQNSENTIVNMNSYDEVDEEELSMVEAVSKGGDLERNARSFAFNYTITMKPMQIRTFIFKMQPLIYDK